MAWDKTIPADDSLLISFPASCRANWEALALRTATTLQIINMKVSSGAAIKESKILFANDGHSHGGGSDGEPINFGFVAGDWIISSVNTAHTGWTNVSATYNNKFFKIHGTPLSTGGSDTHSHTLFEANLPSHTHAAGTLSLASGGAHTHNFTTSRGSNFNSRLKAGDPGNDTFNSNSAGSHVHILSGSTSATGSGTAFTGDNIPAYVTVTVFQKN